MNKQMKTLFSLHKHI